MAQQLLVCRAQLCRAGEILGCLCFVKGVGGKRFHWGFAVPHENQGFSLFWGRRSWPSSFWCAGRTLLDLTAFRAACKVLETRCAPSFPVELCGISSRGFVSPAATPHPCQAVVSHMFVHVFVGAQGACVAGAVFEIPAFSCISGVVNHAL